ncbi:MAG: hypothetical protein ACD_68C00130G0001, partial [uncultured bacterium]
YIQYRVSLLSFGQQSTPAVNDININYTSVEEVTFQATVNTTLTTETIDNTANFESNEVSGGSGAYASSFAASVSNPVAPDPANQVGMSADDVSLVDEYNTSTVVRSEIKDQYGNLVSDGTVVNFSVSENGTVDPASATTTDGAVQTTYTAEENAFGAETVTAQTENGANGTLDITLYEESLALAKSVGLNTGAILGDKSDNSQDVISKKETSAAAFLFTTSSAISILLWALVGLIVLLVIWEVFRAIRHPSPTSGFLKHQLAIFSTIILNLTKRPAVTFVLASQKDRQGTYQYSFTTFKHERAATLWTVSSGVALLLAKLTFGFILPFVLLNFPGVLQASLYDDAGQNVSGGDQLTFRVDYENVGPEEIQNVVIADAVPSGTTYIPTSLVLNGIAQTDVADSDSADFGIVNANSASFAIGMLAPDSSGYLLFRTEITNPTTVASITNSANGNFNPGERTIASNGTTNQIVNGSISGKVFDDSDNDKLISAIEKGLSNIGIRLYEDDGDLKLNRELDPLLATVSTDVNGDFSIGNLGAQAYIIDIDSTTLPADYGITTINEPLYVTLDMGENFRADFGFAPIITEPAPIPEPEPGPVEPEPEPEEPVTPTPEEDETIIIPDEELVTVDTEGESEITGGIEGFFSGAATIVTALVNAIAETYRNEIANNEILQKTNRNLAIPAIAAAALINTF